MSRVERTRGFAALRVEGGLLPPEFLQEIAAQKAGHQADADYRISRSLKLKDELGRYWHIARDLWNLYRQKRQRIDQDPQTAAEEFLVAFFRDVLGYYDLTPVKGATIEERHFAITHRAAEDRVPLLFVSHHSDLDAAERRFGEEGRRRSPSNLMQEYLNADDHVQWGFVSNGSVIRLFRDNPSLTRPTYIECDLELMLTDQIYPDFTAMWLLLHDSRLRPTAKRSSTIIERWRLEAQETGQRVLAHLRDGVAEAMRLLGSGFLAHPANETLRERVLSGQVTPQTYYQQLLRLVYRFLFLFTVEDRNLLFPAAVKPEKRQIYEEGYSLFMLRDRALRRGQDEHYSDLWQGLQIVFRGLSGDQEVGAALGLPALDGLFARGQCPDLEEVQIGNASLLKAVRALTYFRTDSGLARVNYRDMDTEELGSVYEGLLELHPQFYVESRPWSFGFLSDTQSANARGSERKSTGSYYTPASLVDELIKSALEPVLNRAIADRPDNPRQAVLDLNVIDPACGSGHFLLAAARRMAAEIARLESDSSIPDEQVRRRALRDVVQHCIFGVDKNPLAVELCRAALWIETVEPGKPLSFLDAHIQCGDSLIGLRGPAILADGIPMDAYKALTGDEQAAEKELKRRNKGSVYTFQFDLFQPAAIAAPEGEAVDLEAMPEDTVADLEAKRARWHSLQRQHDWKQAKDAADMYVAAFFLPKRMDCLDVVPVNQDMARLVRKLQPRPGVLEAVRRVAKEERFFHWHLAFPQVMSRGGFDVVLGNPPWERVKLQEQEFFAARSPAIAGARNKAERDSLIRQLGRRDASPAERELLAEFQRAKRQSEAASQFLRKGRRFPLTGKGDVNTYAVFAEHARDLVAPGGRAGIIVPTGIATDNSTKEFFEDVALGGRLVSLYDFENRDAIFPGVHRSYKFSLLTLGQDIPEASYIFFATKVDHLAEEERRFTLTPAEISLINPNTKTCPVFRTKQDAELTKKLYRQAPVLIDESKGAAGNPWGITFMTMFHMSNDSGLFRTTDELGVSTPTGGPLEDSRGKTWLPLYEAKMVHHYDHRFNTFESVGTRVRSVTEEEKRDPGYEPLPRYWVPTAEVRKRLKDRGWDREWLLGFRDIARSTDERTFIATVVPLSAVSNKFPLVLPSSDTCIHLIPLLIGNLSALVFDYIVRQKIGSTTLNFFYVKQLPVLAPNDFDEREVEYVTNRVVELVYSSEQVQPFAIDMGFHGPPFQQDSDRRAVLRAELDALYAHKYGLTRDELRYILDPGDIYGLDYPSETFRVLKDNEMKEFGEYRTKRLVLEAWDRLRSGLCRSRCP